MPPKQESEVSLGSLHSLLTFQGHITDDRERQMENYRKNLTCSCVEISHPHNADSPSSLGFKWEMEKKNNHHVWVLSANWILVLFLTMIPCLHVLETTSQCGEVGRERRKEEALPGFQV